MARRRHSTPERPRIAWFIAASLAGAIGGCLAGPDYKRPETVTAASYSEVSHHITVPASTISSPTTKPVSVSEWWTAFNDKTLNSLIDRAVTSNLDLQVATARVVQSRAQAVAVGADQYPQLDAGGGWLLGRGSKTVKFPAAAFGIPSAGKADRQHPNGRAAAPPAEFANSPLGGGGLPGATTNIYQAGFDASWEVDIFGGVARNVEAARADLDASVEDRRDVMVSLLAEVARDYINLRGAQREIEINEENLDSQRQTLGLTIDRFNNGFTTQLDVARAQALVDTTAAGIPTLRAMERTLMHRVATLLGQPPEALADELSEKSPIPPVPPEVPIGLPSDLLRRRPDVRRAERRLAAASARVGVAVADLFPKFSLTGSFGLDSTKPKYVVDWASRYFAFSPAIVWPVFDAGRIRANIDVQNAAEAQALGTYQSSVLTALRDVEDALVNYMQEQSRHRELADAVEANRLAVKLANDQYRQGTADFLTVLDVQRSLYSAEDSLVQSDQAISGDLVALYKALGGGWEIKGGE